MNIFLSGNIVFAMSLILEIRSIFYIQLSK